MNRIEELKAPAAARTARVNATPAKVALVTNVASHYRTKVFEALSRMCDVEFYFYSDGGEWYWQRSHGVVSKFAFVTRYLHGFWIGRTRITPGLLPALLFRDY